MQARTHSTGVRLVRETVKRLSVLTDEEVALLVEATASERGHLMWEFDSFVRAKGLWHEELAALKDSTLQKLRSNVFKMLREAELLSDAGTIVPAVLSERVAARLSASTPSDMRFFPTQQGAVS